MADDYGDDDRQAFRRTNAPSGGKQIQLDQIINSLKDMQRNNFTKETEWLFEKSQMNSKIGQLESQLQAQTNINEDLIRRIKMLEFCLREERIKYARLMQQQTGGSGKDGEAPVNIIDSVLDKANLNANLYERIAKRRAKAQRPLLLKFLQEVGYEDIFNTNEINEIKELYNKAQADLTDSINQANSLHTQKLEEKLLADDSLKQKLVNGTTMLANNAEKEETGADEAAASEPREVSLQIKYELKSHMDIVRGVQFVPSVDAMATISEDCMVKLWNLSDMDRKFAEASSNETATMEPYLTLRGHTGPLLCATSITDSSRDSENKNLLFTAGIEGNIRVWNIPQVSSIQSYGSTLEGKNYCVALWQDPVDTEAIWDLKYHQFQDLLLSMDANNQILLWDCSQIQLNGSEESSGSGTIKHRFQYTTANSNTLVDQGENATCMTWLVTQQNQFVVGYNNGHIVFFDIMSGSLVSAQDVGMADINTIVAHKSRSLVCTGHENGSVSVFDYSADQVIKTIRKAHSDAVSCIAISNTGLQLITGGHDSAIKVWDLRTFGTTSDSEGDPEPLDVVAEGHKKKYDEGVLSLSVHPTMPILVTGGADSSIQVFEMFA